MATLNTKTKQIILVRQSNVWKREDLLRNKSIFMYYVMWIVSFLWMFLDIQTCTPELEPRRQQHSTGNPGPLPLCRSGMFSQGRDPWSDSGSSGWSSWLDRKRNREKQKLLLKSNIKKPTLSQMVPLFFFFINVFDFFHTHWHLFTQNEHHT